MPPPSTTAAINETVNGEEIKKSTKRLAPQPPVVSNNNKMYSKEESSEKNEKVSETVLEVVKNEDQMKMNDINIDKVNNEQNTLKQVDEIDIKVDNNSSLLKNDFNDYKLTNDTKKFNCDSLKHSNKDDDQCHSPKHSVFDDGDSGVKMVENGHHQDNNCQVTILSNHSTIINTVDVPDNQKNISIVTIEDSKNISIKSSDDHLGQNNNKRDRKSESPKIVLNNEYVGSSEKSFEISKPKKDSPKQANNINNKPLKENSNNKAIRTDSSNSKKTTIKVNLNLKSDNVQKNGNKVNAKTDANNYLTRIDQANSISHSIPSARHNNKMNESKSLKRESSNSSSNFGSLGSSDKENKMQNLSPDQSAVIIRKKQEMV